MAAPTHSETYVKLLEHLRLAQEDAAMLAHLHNAEGGSKDALIAKGWMAVSEMLKLTQHNVTKLAQGRLN